MMKTFSAFFLFIITVTISTSTFAQLYKWVDEKGVVHFTDDFTKVPEKYRAKTEKIGLFEESTESKTGADTPAKIKEDPYRDRLGRGEDYWKNRVEEWKIKLRTAQEKMEMARVKYNELTEKFNDSKNIVERNHLRRERDKVKQEMDHYKNLINEAKMMLEKKIPEEAELYKAKKEWIKE